MAIIILIDISILNVVIVVISKNASIIQSSVPLSFFPLEAIVGIRRIEVFSSVSFISCIVVVIHIEVPVVILTKIVVIGASVISLEVVIFSL